MPQTAEAVDVPLLKRRFVTHQTDRQSSGINDLWDQAERWILPLGGSGPGNPDSKVEWERTGIWDFTAIDGNQKLAANIHGTATSSSVRWFKFTFRNKELMNDAEARGWLDTVSDTTFDVLQDSDFNTEIASGYQEYSGYGNMVIMCEVAKPGWGGAWKGIDFTAIPVRECYVEENSTGGLYRFYRHLRWTAVQIKDKWPEATLPEVITRALESPEAGITKFDCVFAIYHRTRFSKDDKGKPLYPVEAKMREVGACYFLLDTAQLLGEETGYYEMPTFLARWERTANSPWGHGPGIHALPSVRYLNSWCEITKGAAAKSVDPMTFVTEEGMLGDFDFSPGAVNVSRSKEDVWTHESRGNFVVADQTIQDLRQMVRQIFHADDLQLKESPEMTATEAQIRYELMQRVLGSTLSRLISECLSPMLTLVVGLLLRNNRLPNPPPQVQKVIDELDLNIEYQGPLARAQRTDEVAAIERLAAQVAGLSKFFPQVLDVFDPNEAVREIGKRLGVPASVLASKQDVIAKGKERAALQSRMANAEAARAEGEAGQQVVDAATAAAESPINIPGIGAGNVVDSPAAPPL